MKKLLVVLLLALPAFAEMPRDEKVETLANDLRALSRINALAKDLGDTRQVQLAIADANIDSLRMPRENGTYQWASLQREEASRVSDEKTIEKVSTEAELRNVTITAPNAYRLVVTVPTKRNLFNANNRVYVRNLLIDSTGFDGKLTHTEIPVNVWVNPGDTNSTALPDIGKSVKATAELGVESGSKSAVAQVALLQAKLVDDPTSPYYPAVTRLLKVRELVAAHDMNRGQLRTTIDEALLALPGELEKRAADQQRALQDRQTANGTITAADASPDVIDALANISRMLNGTLQEQSDARARLQELIEKLRPLPAQ
ncbi:MAG TPA: hypothetical protein VFN10_10985 [Thermoanaerobaculia bacterium]|nr:hypothetical protein [Thermoanaerobaculia bacterium]